MSLSFVILIFAGLMWPVTNSTCIKGAQTKALAQAKQIGLALKIYASDHDGMYPAGVNAYGETIRSSNDAFRDLFPTYTQSETIFGNKLSAYQTHPPDNIITPKIEPLRPGESDTLRAGENVYSYIMGVTDKSSGATTPLVVDGTDGTGRGLYVSDPRARGGVWKGTKAVAIYLDNHGAVENLTGPADARYIAVPAPNGETRNLLSPAALGPNLKLLDPAVARPPQ